MSPISSSNPYTVAQLTQKVREVPGSQDRRTALRMWRMTDRDVPGGPVRRTWAAVFAVMVLSLLVGSYWYYRVETESIRQKKHGEIAAIGELKANDIERWRSARLADAGRVARDPLARRTVEAFLREPGDPDRRAELRERLKVEQGEQYVDVLLLDAAGNILLAAKDAPDPVDPATELAIAAALANPEAVLSELYRTPAGVIVLDVAVAVRDAGGRPAAAVILRSGSVESYLYPLIQTWPTPSRSAETFLVRQIGGEVVYLNELRHQSNTALSLRVPLTRTDIPAVQAVLGRRGEFEGKDYRGMDVLADLRPIPGSSWFLMAKVDTDEILAEAHYRTKVIASFVVYGILLAGVVSSLAYRQRLAGFYRNLYESERELRLAQAQFRATLYSIGDGVITTDSEGRVRQMNRAAERLTGWSEAGAQHNHLEDVFRIINEETRAAAEDPVQHVLREGTVVGLANHTLLIARDGSERPIADSAAPIREEGGPINGVVLVFSDQTTERAALRTLEESERDLREAQEVGRLGSYVYDIPADAWRSSAVLDGILGIGADFPHTAAGWMELVHPSHRDEMRSHLFDFSGGRPRFEKEYRIVRANDGAGRWVLGLGAVEYGADGTPLRMVGTTQDITERKQAEGKLPVQSAALNAAANAIVITDRTGTITWINPAFTVLTGYSAEEAIGKNPRELVKSGAHDRAFYKHMWDTIRAGDVWHGEMTNRRKGGGTYAEDVTITPVRDACGEITHFVGIKRDLTEQHRLEAEFLQAQKMETVGRLAGGIAHDFNNLLTVINGTADLVWTKLQERDPLRADLQHIHRAGRRAAELTRQLLAFSRKQIMNPGILNLSTLVANLRSMIQRVIGEDIELLVVPATDLGSVRADPGQIEQVVLNLVVNARDAMPSGGTLTIETRDVELDEAFAAAHPSLHPGRHVLLAVRDTGVGMDEATCLRIFEPFFTTKDSAKGTGLGLSTAYGIVKQSGGTIWVDSERGRGTTFTIYLPRVEEVADTYQLDRTLTMVPGTETILLVEDEEDVLSLAMEFLQSAGYTVLLAGNGEEALRLLDRHEGSVHLVLTDVVMPGMSGRELATRIAAVRPEIKVLYTSGYTDDAILRHGVLDQGTHFIGKPYTAAELTRKVRAVLDAPDAT